MTWTDEDRAFFHMIAEANERRSFRAKLDDLGDEHCDVCKANGLREAWGQRGTMIEPGTSG